MLYILNLIVYFVWTLALMVKRNFSWHSIITAYVIAVFIIDMMEVLLNLLLNLYRFPTHLISNPIYDNQLGIIFADTLILPLIYIIFIHYTKKDQPWRTTILFTLGHIIFELIYLKLGYLQYNNWQTVYSAALYLITFRFGAFLAPRIISYNPPVPNSFRLLCFGYTANMWVCAIFGMPVLKCYQFKTGMFGNFMADDRFVDLYSGLALAAIGAVLLPKISVRLRPLSCTVIASIGVAFAFYFYSKGWLIYHYWNHLFMILRYLVPFVLIILYDGWESSYQKKYS